MCEKWKNFLRVISSLVRPQERNNIIRIQIVLQTRANINNHSTRQKLSPIKVSYDLRIVYINYAELHAINCVAFAMMMADQKTACGQVMDIQIKPSN